MRNKIKITKMSIQTKKIQTFDNISKSLSDKRLYKGIILENQLKCLLISDPTTDRAAASMTVNTGSMLDPDQLPGLAHFCEHMLFMGSKKVQFSYKIISVSCLLGLVNSCFFIVLIYGLRYEDLHFNIIYFTICY